jgi:F-type H+-transporting ATPase subunit alpha
LPVEEQVVSIFAGTRGYLDDVEIADVRRFEAGLLEDVRARYGGALAEIRSGGGLPENELASAISSFKERFVGGRAVGDIGAEASADVEAAAEAQEAGGREVARGAEQAAS